MCQTTALFRKVKILSYLLIFAIFDHNICLDIFAYDIVSKYCNEFAGLEQSRKL